MDTKIVLSVVLTILLAILVMPSIPQDLAYHQFADQRALYGIANFFNVISNLPFIVTGLLGVGILRSNSSIELIESVRFVYLIFFVGVFLVGLGSSYYHLWPENSTLVWDRLPMVVSFMSFFSIVIAEFIDERLSKTLFVPLLLSGLASVFYWYWTELSGHGDLSAYILVQFLPLVVMPVIFLTRTSRFNYTFCFWLVLVCYGFAKGLELSDFQVYELTGSISGHSLKHIVSAIGPALFCLALIKRVAR
ncbi:MAG: ceramidase [Gammaproteobacteria bacterium]|nr:ceramidase [Gammaproteobacteria bacterium]